jgi:host factor-I protein
MFSSKTLQDNYIDDLIQRQRKVSVYLKNGIRLRGDLVSQNNEAVFLREGITQMIQKNLISTISPEMEFLNYENPSS